MSRLVETIQAPFTGSSIRAQVLRVGLVIFGFLFALDTPGLLKFSGDGWTDFTPAGEGMSGAWDGVLNSLPTITNGGSQGTLYGLLAVGLILIYRTNKIINFAVAAIGAVPAVFAVLLVLTKGVPWIVALPMALLGGVLFGALTDILIVRRFRDSPRLIVTVATIGIAQILAFINLYVPKWLGIDGLPPGNFSDKTPFGGLRITNSADVLYGTGNNIAALLAVVGCALGLQLFFKRSKLGIALRASAENADRAGLLGIPVKRVQTVAWGIAGLFGATVIFFQASVTSIPLDGSLGYGTLLFALAAAVVAKMESIPTAVLAGVAIGIVDFATVQNVGESSISTAVMLVFILVALIFQKGGGARAKDTGVSSFKALQEFRPVPPEMRHLKEVRIAKIILLVALTAVFVGAPFVVGDADLTRLTFLPIFAMVGLSLVVLTGWAGQISLGQFAFVGVGAVTAAKLFVDHGWDFWLTLGAAAIAGAVVAVLVGLPALRVQGLLLAVTSLALAAAAAGYLFVDKNDKYRVGRAILPSGDVLVPERPVLWGRVDYRLEAPNGFFSGDRGFYYFCCVLLVMMFLAASSYRRNHGGRLLIASRDNERAAQSYSISIIRTRLAAFAVSGAMASIAGALFYYLLLNVNSEDYGIANSIDVFVATVIGGLTSLGGAIAGVVIVKGISLFGEEALDGLSLLVTGPGLLVVLLFLPGGLAEGFFALRDRYLRHLAGKHGLVVPSLIADVLRVEDLDDDSHDSIITRAEQHAEEIDHAQVLVCPVCNAAFSPQGALDHAHFRPQHDDEIWVIDPVEEARS
ncbi:branched-chain amino acid ABC transporter permease [Actinospongicola halichondriae]|uniref:branched-chain amino acid ABC transporter permease n=1 Tax=Actinospongicola halichondriae TaxID=3236844 RepID=UPI003D396CDA